MYNKAFLIGNLTRDPEMRYTTGGIPVTRFTIAINRRFGEKEEVDFIRVVTWRKQAEFCGEYLSKGKMVAVEGRLQVDSYEKDGKRRYTSEIVADNVQFLSRKDGEQGVALSAQSSGTEPVDDIPF
ncbi:MAG: single-stranded DNA-binding protein [Candidatus Margulisiibacteriota bacterium]